MIIAWKEKVFYKLKTNLLDALAEILEQDRAEEVREQIEKQKKLNPIPIKSVSITEEEVKEQNSSNYELIAKFGQSMADLSINELTVHFLGSTKFIPEESYDLFNNVFLRKTKYFTD